MPIGWAITVVVLCVAVVVIAVVQLGLLRQVTPLLERASTGTGGPDVRTLGPAIGSPLPHFAARDAQGSVTSEQLRGPAVLLFLSVGCGPCKTLVQQIRSGDFDGLADELIIITGTDGIKDLGIPDGLRVLTEPDRGVSGPLSVLATPFAVVIDADRIVKAVLVPGSINDLIGALA